MTWLVVIAVLCLMVGAARWAIWRGFQVARAPMGPTPAAYGFEHEVRIPTSRGRRLRGWLLTADSQSPLVVVTHGWGSCAAAMLPLAAPLRTHGYSVLLFDARNHGRSDGDNFSSMPRFAEDIEACLDWVHENTSLAPAAIALLGHSVGGAASLLAASRRNDVSAVISLSAFDHPERVMRSYLARARIPYRPIGWMVCRYVERIIGHRFDDIAPATTIANVRCPVFIGHGADDRLVQPAAAHAIYSSAIPGTACLAILDATGHDEPADFEQVNRLLLNFLDGALNQGCLGPTAAPMVPNRASKSTGF